MHPLSFASQSKPSEPTAPVQSTSDAGIGAYFVWLRRQTGLSLHCTAAMLHTEAEVIEALEAGAVGELPAWPETLRIVSAYAAMSNTDPHAPLTALYQRWPAAAPQPAASPTAAKPRAPVKAQAVAAAKSKRVKTTMAARNAGMVSMKFW